MILALVLKIFFRKGTQKHKRRNSNRTYVCYLKDYRKLPYFYEVKFFEIVYGNWVQIKVYFISNVILLSNLYLWL